MTTLNTPLGSPVVVQGDTEIYGRGWAFPFEFDPITGGIAKSSGQQAVEDSFIFILGTFIGERPMKPGFGSRIDSVLFELQSEETKALLRTYIAEAAVQEPRIQAVHEVDISNDPGDDQRLVIEITYRLIQQTTDTNLVLPILRGAQ